ncbi:Ig-like domain-containing protein [Paraglaciecola mesophila]|uniref:Ig-like domain-containing protein n=1 Tax=Paraglaciecola mesophila TaxID=197222 RepID=A0ABU9SQQ5_9ALTE
MSDTAQITVSQWYEKPLEAIQLSAAKTNLIAGDELTLSASFTPENPDSDQLKWVSSVPQIATVDTNGNLHALTAGSVTVTAKAEANPSIQGSIDFHVQADVKPFIKIDNLAQLINQPLYQRKGLSPLISGLKVSFIHWK